MPREELAGAGFAVMSYDPQAGLIEHSALLLVFHLHGLCASAR